MDYKNELGNWEEIILEPSGDTLPIGAITQFSGSIAPTNWLFCNGQAISRAEYSELFAIIGTHYGEGDGSTTFNLPDFIGRVPVGLDAEDPDFDALGDFGGEKTHKLTSDEIPVTAFQSSGDTGTWYYLGRGTAQPHNNIQPYLVTNFIIKVKQSVGIVGTVTTNIDDPNTNAVPNAGTVKNYVDEITELTTYSTEEKVVGKWINDKLIYRKVVNFGALPNTSEKNVPHNISNFNFATKIGGIAYNSDGRTFPLPAVSFGISSGNITPSIYVFADKTNITIGTGVDRSAYNGYVIIEYTKTVD